MILREFFKEAAKYPPTFQLGITATGIAADLLTGRTGACAIAGFIIGALNGPAIASYFEKKFG